MFNTEQTRISIRTMQQELTGMWHSICKARRKPLGSAVNRKNYLQPVKLTKTRCQGLVKDHVVHQIHIHIFQCNKNFMARRELHQTLKP